MESSYQVATPFVAIRRRYTTCGHTVSSVTTECLRVKSTGSADIAPVGTLAVGCQRQCIRQARRGTQSSCAKRGSDHLPQRCQENQTGESLLILEDRGQRCARDTHRKSSHWRLSMGKESQLIHGWPSLGPHPLSWVAQQPPY